MNKEQGPLRVGIQGVRAAFHEVAAKKFFAGTEFVPVECSTFPKLSSTLQDGEADYCMMAIENSIAGSILTNYALLERYGFKIIGEVYLRIEMNLMALPGQKIENLKSVHSHPMALLQCEDFLSRYPMLTAIEAADTAESAKVIAEKKIVGQAAIASKLAAELYGLEIYKAGIESNKLNYTRFLAVCRNDEYRRPFGSNKASIGFESFHKPGSLVGALEIFRKYGINMTKIQSVPILSRPYEYSFHVDLEWQNLDDYERAIEELPPFVRNLVHFGEYPRGDRPTL